MSGAIPAHLARALSTAQETMALIPLGESVVGWKARTLSQPVRTEDGAAWLRIVASPSSLAHGSWWSGNADAASVTELPRPQLFSFREWDAPDAPGWRIRAELMQRLEGRVLAPTPQAPPDTDVPPGYWAALDGHLDRLAGVETARSSTVPATVHHLIRTFFGRRFPAGSDRWTTAHGDLHFANLLADPLGIVDWEAWGRGPEHLDIATLYVHALAAPRLRRELGERFGERLASPNGRVSLAFVCAKVLGRAVAGDYADLVDPVHRVLDRLDRSPTPFSGMP